MSSYYHRDKEGNWFVKHGKELVPVEFSGSLELAYRMGKVKALNEINKRLAECWSEQDRLIIVNRIAEEKMNENLV